MSKSYSVFVNSIKCTMRLDVERITFQTDNSSDPSPADLRSRVIDHADWFLLKNNCALHIYTTAKRFYSISELSINDKETITQYLIDQFQLDSGSIKTYNVQISGTNEGELTFHEKSFSLIKDDRVVLNIPFAKIDQFQAQSPKDLTVQFDTDEDLHAEQLFSIRFFVPLDAEHNAKDLRSELDQRTNSSVGTDNYLAELREVNFVKPRIKYNLRFCDDLLFMCNKEGSHKIPYSKISMIHRFTIPSDDDKKSEYILISLSRPIRQGQKSYPHLVIETSSSDPVSADGVEEKKTFIDVFEDLMNRVAEIKFQTTEGYYKNVAHEQGSICYYKNNRGSFYMTSDAFVFLHSNVIYVPFKNVKSVKFDKVSLKSKHFDLEVTDRQGTYTFTSIITYPSIQLDDKENDDEDNRTDREQMMKEYVYNGVESVYRFIKGHNLKIEDRSELRDKLHEMKSAISTHDRQSKVRANEAMRNIKDQDMKLGLGDVEGEEEDDEDFNPNAKESDDDKDDDDDDDKDEDGEGDGDDDDDDDDEEKDSKKNSEDSD